MILEFRSVLMLNPRFAPLSLGIVSYYDHETTYGS